MKTTILLLLLTINLYAQSGPTIKNISDYKTGEEFLSLINKKIIIAPLRNANFPDVNLQITKRYKTDYKTFEVGEFRPLTINEYDNTLANSLVVIDKVKFIDGNKEISLSEFNEKVSAGLQTYPSVKLYGKINNQYFEFINTYGGLNFSNLIPLDVLDYYKTKIIGKKYLNKSVFKIDRRLNMYSEVPPLYTNNDLMVATDVRVSHLDSTTEKVDKIFVYLRNLWGTLR